MNNIILIIVAIFFVIGASDYLLNNKFNYGKIFEEGINNMGGLALSMVGIISLTPIIGQVIGIIIKPITDKIGLDSSIITSIFLAIDMGALNLSKELSATPEMIAFSGVLMGAMVGCTVSFTLPLALGIVKGKSREDLSLGILCGIATLPIGLFIAGLLLKINLLEIIKNLLPILIISVLVGLGLFFKQRLLMKTFNILGKCILILSVCGLILQGINSITGIEIVEGLMPLEEALVIVGKIAIFLGGAYVMIEWINRTFKKVISSLGDKLGLTSTSVAAFIGSLASAIIVFSVFEKLDRRGKVICSAFTVGGAYVFGGQMGYVASEAPEFLNIYIFTKLLCGILSVIFAAIMIKREKLEY